MNGGPADYLYWIIESKDPDFSPDKAKEWLEKLKELHHPFKPSLGSVPEVSRCIAVDFL